MHFGRVLSRVDGMIHSTELVRAARRSIVGYRARFHGPFRRLCRRSRRYHRPPHFKQIPLF